MAQPQMKTPNDVVERNLRLTGEVMRYLLNHPQIFSALPDKFELVILPEDDPEIRLYNLDMLDRYGSDGKDVVIARLRTQSDSMTRVSPSLFVQLPLAA